MSYLQKHPKTGVYRVRRLIPEEARKAFQGRAVFLKSVGSKDLAEAKRKAFPILAEVQAKIDRALAGAIHWQTHNLDRAVVDFHEWMGNGQGWGEPTLYETRAEFNQAFSEFVRTKLPSLKEPDRDELRRHIEAESDDGHPLHPPESKSKPKTKPAPSKQVTLKGLRQAQLDHGGYSKRSVADVTKAWDYLIELNGDVQITDISRDQILELRTLLLKFPVVGRTPGLKLRDAAKREWANTVTPRTVQKIVGFIGTGFKLARSEGWCETNPAEGIKIPKQTPTSKPKPTEDFGPADLTNFFNSPLYRGCLNEHRITTPGNLTVRDFRYWLPLLSLFGGVRMGELCQLETTDVREDNGIWYLDITSKADEEDLEGKKTLKTEGSKRQVPLAQTLLDLGFVEWAQKQKDRKGLLFQSGYPTLDVLKREVSKRFRHYMKRIELKRDGLVFHSFRHTFKTNARLANIPEPIIDCIEGHLPQTVAAQYGKNKRRIEVLRDYIDQVQFEGMPKLA